MATGRRLSLGGPLVGFVIGPATSWLLENLTHNDLQSEVTLTIVCCYSCFLVAEGTELHVSGVLAVVFAGLYLSFYGRGNISVKVGRMSTACLPACTLSGWDMAELLYWFCNFFQL